MKTFAEISEAEMIGAFLRNSRDERWQQILSTPKGRKKFLARLDHEKDINPSCMVPIPHLERFPNLVFDKLTSLGAPNTCHVISASMKADGSDVPLLMALEDVLEGTILVCVPGKLAYFLSEERNGQYILRA